MGADSRPEIEVVGPGEPVAAVVGGVHGDEPSGVRAIERVRRGVEAGTLRLDRAVRLVVANPPALAAGRRFLEADMNRSFPGDAAGTGEARLAAMVCEAVAGLPTLALHATRSGDRPFGFAAATDPVAIELACSLPLPHLVLADGAGIGALSACGTVVTVEAGRQGTDAAADSAYELTVEFLRATGALAGSPSAGNPVVFELGPEIERPTGRTYEVVAENFAYVAPGEPYAIVDGEELVAEAGFYPILLSVDGYADILGYRGQLLADSPADLAAVLDGPE